MIQFVRMSSSVLQADIHDFIVSSNIFFFVFNPSPITKLKEEVVF